MAINFVKKPKKKRRCEIGTINIKKTIHTLRIVKYAARNSQSKADAWIKHAANIVEENIEVEKATLEKSESKILKTQKQKEDVRSADEHLWRAGRDLIVPRGVPISMRKN